MRTLPHALPTEASAAGDAAREIGRLIGPAMQAPDGSVSAAELLAAGDAVAAHDATVTSLRSQVFATLADVMLQEWEDSLGLPRLSSLTTDTRRARVVAKLRAGRGNAADVVKAALYPIAGDVTLTPTKTSWVRNSEPLGVNSPFLNDGNPSKNAGSARNVYRMSVLVNTSVFDNAALRPQVDTLLSQMQPAHCLWRCTPGFGRQFDVSKFDREVYGL